MTWDLQHREALEDRLLRAESAEREHLTLIHRLREELQDAMYSVIILDGLLAGPHYITVCGRFARNGSTVLTKFIFKVLLLPLLSSPAKF